MQFNEFIRRNLFPSRNIPCASAERDNDLKGFRKQTQKIPEHVSLISGNCVG
jgi:hypothetical protein